MKQQQGLSLVELMVSMVSSLILMVGVLQIYVSNNMSYQLQSGFSRIQENSRFALNVLSQQVRMADYRADVTTTSLSEAVSGTHNNGLNGSDSLSISYQGSSTVVNGNSVADGTVLDCTGAAVAADQTVTMTFSVASVNGTPALQCNNGTTTVTLVEGVENMQVLFGVAGDVGGASVAAERYLDANSFTADADLWLDVVSVRIGLLLQSDGDVRTDNDTTTYTLAGIVSVSSDQNAAINHAQDQRIRRVVNTTITLRNRAR